MFLEVFGRCIPSSAEGASLCFLETFWISSSWEKDNSTCLSCRELEIVGSRQTNGCCQALLEVEERSESKSWIAWPAYWCWLCGQKCALGCKEAEGGRGNLVVMCKIIFLLLGRSEMCSINVQVVFGGLAGCRVRDMGLFCRRRACASSTIEWINLMWHSWTVIWFLFL